MLLACSEPKNRDREAIVLLSGMKRAAAAFATAPPARARMCENEEPTCAAKESGDESAKSWGDGRERQEFVEAELASIQRKRT
jgi:hypothetical protein